MLEFCRHGSMSNVFTPTHPSRSQMHVAVNPMWSSERMGSDLMPVNQQAVQPPESSPAREPLGPSTPSTPGVNAFTMVGIPALSPNEASGPAPARVENPEHDRQRIRNRRAFSGKEGQMSRPLIPALTEQGPPYQVERQAFQSA